MLSPASHKKFDNLWLGIAIGTIAPVLTTFILAKVVYPDGYLDNLYSNTLLFFIAPKIISLAVLPNLASFLLFTYTSRYSSAKGVLGTTIVFAIIVFILKLSA
jgi:hypothetical protein